MKAPIPLPVSRLDDRDMQAVPDALRRAAENARRLAEQTGTPFVVRQPGDTDAATDTGETVRISPVPNHLEKLP
jgi:hypothetical protein